jgi:hypothetical protein
MVKPAKPKKPEAEKTALPMRTLDDIDVSKGPKRVKALREKFEKALEDPDMREAMARYLQNLIRDGK